MNKLSYFMFPFFAAVLAAVFVGLGASLRDAVVTAACGMGVLFGLIYWTS